MSDQDKMISFRELVDVRRDEMQSMLPGLQAEVSIGDKTAIVYSPAPYEKYKVRKDR